MTRTKTDKKQILSWCLFDFGNSAHSAIVATFIISVYFARVIYGDETAGSALWAQMTGLSALLTALCAPFLGAYCDLHSAKKKGLIVTSLITIIATAGLFFMKGEPSFVYPTLLLAGLSLLALELAVSVNNAMLFDIAPAEKRGRISGFGWGFGYIGGLISLIACLLLFVGLGDILQPLIKFDNGSHLDIRITALFTALWFLIFAIPIFLFYQEADRPVREKRHVFEDVKKTVRNLIQLKEPQLIKFLIASALYRDGLITLFAVGGLYAAGTFAMDFSEILIFAIGLNITAGFGAIGFGFLDDKLGSKTIIILSLLGLILVGCATLIVQSKLVFIGLALLLGLFMGPCQSASRVFMAEMSPPTRQTEFFGFYALTGKSIAFTGPILFGFLTQISGSQRIGMLAVIFLLISGLSIMLTVKKERAHV